MFCHCGLSASSNIGGNMKRKNVFQKADEFVKKVRERIPEASFHDCKKWAGRIANNYSYKKKPTIKLSKNEVIVNDLSIIIKKSKN